jgi:hypothetical protein
MHSQVQQAEEVQIIQQKDGKTNTSRKACTLPLMN